MRPIERSDCPTDGSDQPVAFRKYADAKPALTTRLGRFCSYCEMPILNGPAVEHKQPKATVKEYELTWSNFLLSCFYCNSSKSDDRLVLEHYLWPDCDNTFRAFSYVNGVVNAATNLDSTNMERACRTIELAGLDKLPNGRGRQKASDVDNRYEKRVEAWRKAEDAKAILKNERDTPKMREYITGHALETGFFSVWMAVFADDTDMKQRFIEAFPGTCTCCFDPQGTPLPRPDGAL